ncbi:hypothetical protein [Skermanella pratensis]|uniref:hypothetical protein n=1 Tax=Skermanella pratensis TaxID=2233999 RepID=UPI0013017901|nr:hypothetical protein [Skermanella pratensis]
MDKGLLLAKPAGFEPLLITLLDFMSQLAPTVRNRSLDLDIGETSKLLMRVDSSRAASVLARLGAECTAARMRSAIPVLDGWPDTLQEPESGLLVLETLGARHGRQDHRLRRPGGFHRVPIDPPSGPAVPGITRGRNPPFAV